MKTPRHLMKAFWSAALVATLLAACGAAPPETRSGVHDAGVHEAGAEPEHGHGAVVLTPEAADRAGIRTALVVERVMESELSTTGQVDFDQARLAHVSPRITGRVHRVRARLGEKVGAGETLAEIDSIELGRTKAEFLQARARQELARANHERESRLFSDRISSEREVLTAEAELREATATLLTAEETLHLYGLDQRQVEALSYDDPSASIYPLRAPFAGLIVERHATRGELVTPERNLFTLADLSRVWIWIDVYERDLRRVHLDDQAQVQVEAYPEEVFHGQVSYLSAQVDVDTRTVRARIDVANADGKLRPGMFARIRLLDPHGAAGREALEESLVVPADALQRDGDETIVFTPEGVHRFRRREVRLGRAAGDFVEVLDGLEAGEQVVVAGAFLLKSEADKETMGEGHGH